MRRWRTALISMTALAALLVPVQPAAADQGEKPRDAAGPFVRLGHSKTKAPAREAALVDHSVTIHGIDRNGAQVAPVATIIDTATGTEYPLNVSGDTLTGSVPPGDYSLTAIVVTGDPWVPDSLALYGNPTLTVGADTDITLDARTASEVKAVSPSTTATEVDSYAQIVDEIAGQEISTTLRGNSTVPLYAWPSASTTRPYHFVYVESQVEPLTTLPSPRAYNLAFPTSGQIPSTLTFTATPASLALVNTTYGSQGVASTSPGPHSVVIDFDGFGGRELGLTHPADAPSTQRVYYTAAGVHWTGNYLYTLGQQVAENDSGPRTYTAGSTYSENWNKAAFGPTLRIGHGQGLFVTAPLLADSSVLDHQNLGGQSSTGTTGSLTLYRNGVQVGTSTNPLGNNWTVPPQAANYRLDLAVQRTVGWSKYATKINASWKFPSAEGSTDPFVDQHNVLQPRIGGNFDTSGRAPSGTTFPLDVYIQRPPGGTAVASISLKASFNDGATWTTVTLTPNGTDRWTANVTHPAVNNGYVALRFQASDSSGYSVDQTVTRAYGLS
ncbi:hypothetical protein [Actinomadura chibensis]|uniref:Carboxypeptidase regulatory-like domain-containing protein n=1 Tax=Actinomadura chibensis TaxID=392828 RepID=A0A5D0NU16_9ACTN|nr:hypothetical protein [Actinomadura chibensis]TYB48133.1 hypothetical protein FXF69_02600 [Actinomadura chibensis]